MKKLILAPLALILVAGSALAQEGPPRAPKRIPCEEFVKDLPGKQLDATLTYHLNRAGLSLRIAVDNGKPNVSTFDFRDNRVNVEIEQSKIVRAYCG